MPLHQSFKLGVPLTKRATFLKNILFISLFMRDTQREAETQAEGEAGSTLNVEPNAGLDINKTKGWNLTDCATQVPLRKILIIML